ncbi:hypothetical protein AB2B41_08010 [Marimonas sp. MJW-29]|uniref:DUF2946 domain-containing protein n=1 Tax=Sulfitobacter sediminis TaxID=3234186 RepID=A0ABV3RKN4_9RHOB
MTPRGLISLCLALMLALTSQVMAVTRVSADATGQMVLCVGAEIVTVYVDEEGQPTAAPHRCPDCALSEGFVPEPPRLMAPQEVAAAFLVAESAKSILRAERSPKPHTRAPPIPV